VAAASGRRSAVTAERGTRGKKGCVGVSVCVCVYVRRKENKCLLMCKTCLFLSPSLPPSLTFLPHQSHHRSVRRCVCCSFLFIPFCH